MNSMPDAAPASGGEEVERIRDIIFGSQMKAYDGSLVALRADTEQLRQHLGRLQAQLAEAEAEQARRLQGLRADITGDMDGLRTELRAAVERLDHGKADRELLGRLLMDLGHQLVDRPQTLGERLAALGRQDDAVSPPT